jgi:C_GCAxxG_C_C family probable redox protein
MQHSSIQTRPGTHRDRAVAYFMQGYNCAQSTAAAFAEDFGLEVQLVLRTNAGFGGGVGGLRETCGAVSGMVYVAGLHAGAYAPDDLAAKTALYDWVKGMIREFVDQHGTTCCRELLEKASCPVRPDPSERNAEYYAVRPCARFVATAAEIISRTLRTPPPASTAPDSNGSTSRLPQRASSCFLPRADD